MDYEAWTVAADGRSASHVSGWVISVQGDPSQPHEVNPGSLPGGIEPLQQARLLRHGIEAIAKAAKGKPRAAERAKQLSQQFASDPKRQRKPKLSLKPKATEPV
ncbi:MAG: hypothetical protein OIF38_18190 [Cellvibrionaceae bacterium]|nr:hypothetical protein [Cellvibrionaceae bacterium]